MPRSRSLRFTAVMAFLLAQSICCLGADTSSATQEAFRKIQSLAGKWNGKDEQGHPVKTEFVSVVSNTAMMETLKMPGMEEMLTLYSVDLDSIALAHYCPTNNQPRMRAIPTTTPVRELTFAFSGAGNLPDTKIGHENKLVLQFTDADHITERWTWQKNGNDTEMIFNFVRIRSRQK